MPPREVLRGVAVYVAACSSGRSQYAAVQGLAICKALRSLIIPLAPNQVADICISNHRA